MVICLRVVVLHFGAQAWNGPTAIGIILLGAENLNGPCHVQYLC